jgi:hypothetical protein
MIPAALQETVGEAGIEPGTAVRQPGITRVSNFFSSSYSMQRQKLFHLFHIESKLFQNYSTYLLLQPKKAHKQLFILLGIIFQKNSLNL